MLIIASLVRAKSNSMEYGGKKAFENIQMLF